MTLDLRMSQENSLSLSIRSNITSIRKITAEPYRVQLAGEIGNTNENCLSVNKTGDNVRYEMLFVSFQSHFVILKFCFSKCNSRRQISTKLSFF